MKTVYEHLQLAYPNQFFADGIRSSDTHYIEDGPTITELERTTVTFPVTAVLALIASAIRDGIASAQCTGEQHFIHDWSNDATANYRVFSESQIPVGLEMRLSVRVPGKPVFAWART
ncbi:MAG: hypothetical protein U1E73_09875 [Planctomycetota bacterium]